jgi:hypothetical protein
MLTDAQGVFLVSYTFPFPFRRCAAIGALILPVFLVGCGGGGGSTAADTRTQRGTLAVSMADAPPAGGPKISSVNITIGRVEANVGGEWTPITSVPQSFDLLDLAMNEKLLGSASLPAGRYNQVRFFPTATTVTDTEGTHPVNIAGADQTGVKVNLDYEITPETVTTVLLDFNVAKSIIRQGNGQYRMQPVIPAVVKVLSGTITGTVTDAAGAPVEGASVTATYMAGTAYPVGTEVNTSTSQATTGAFKIWALLPGTYTLTVTYTDPATGTAKNATKEGVVVTANTSTDAGAIALP